jgi:hypothetical protein
MENQAWKIFNELEPRYRSAYKIENEREINTLEYRTGWVRLSTYSGCFTEKVRVRKFEQMTEELERRIKNKV